MTSIEIGLAVNVKRRDEVRFVFSITEHSAGTRIRANAIEETLSNEDAKRALTDLRDMADRALQRHWPEDQPEGRHRKGNEA